MHPQQMAVCSQCHKTGRHGVAVAKRELEDPLGNNVFHAQVRHLITRLQQGVLFKLIDICSGGGQHFKQGVAICHVLTPILLVLEGQLAKVPDDLLAFPSGRLEVQFLLYEGVTVAEQIG